MDYLKKEKINFKKNALIKGTLILTIAGFITRLIGFFYRIFLSNNLGAEKLGIYQLIFPVYGICFTIYATGIQTSISRLVARAAANYDKKKIHSILKTGVTLSFLIAIFLSFVIYSYSDYISWRLLLEPRSSSSIKLLVIVFPFCSITSCINGYYYGLKKAGVPASTQLLEQIIRVITVYMASIVLGGADQKITCELAVLGIVIGEVFSSIYNITSLFFITPEILHLDKSNKNTQRKNQNSILVEILKLSIPLSSNRLLINILSSIEAVLIPSMLKRTGLTTKEALSIFGVLNGMSIPFILFPSTIANSFAVMLLPMISEAQASYNDRLISLTTSLTMKYSIIIGILSTGVFILFGKDLGSLIFNNNLSGDFLVILAWLCPFLYLTTTLSSIINGLGKTYITFINSIVGVIIRIGFIILMVPKYGIKGYLFGLLTSQLIISFLDIYNANKFIKITFNAYDWILKPSILITIEGFFIFKLYNYLSLNTQVNQLILLLFAAVILTTSYIFSLLIFKSITIDEIRKTK
ncbi:MAG TPA: polysaccharide biosynthesis protein [Clostridiales bacterium]|nr:polysaccharide biosynthesis protein [Clostridiales bacterium]